MSEIHDEQAAQQREQDRTDELARQNEEVRRAEHPEEFTDEPGDDPAAVAPVAPASLTGANTPQSTSLHSPDPEELSRLAEIEQTIAAIPPTTFKHVRATLEAAAAELRHKLFREPTL